MAFLSPKINLPSSNNRPQFSGYVFFKLYFTSLWPSWLGYNLSKCEALTIFHEIKSLHGRENHAKRWRKFSPVNTV